MPSERRAIDSPAPVTEARMKGAGRIPVRTVYGIGRNYAAHARELGNAVADQPVVFLKPPSSLIGDGGTLLLPHQSADVQHEVEIVLLLGKSGRQVARDRAPDLIAGYGVGIDVTARDLQRKAQAEGNPWAVAKGFDTFGPISAFVPAARILDRSNLAFDLTVNGQLRQQGSSAGMLFDFAALLSYLSGIFTLRAGDLIFTGTPKGVGRIAPGDVLTAALVDYHVSVTVTACADESR